MDRAVPGLPLQYSALDSVCSRPGQRLSLAPWHLSCTNSSDGVVGLIPDYFGIGEGPGGSRKIHSKMRRPLQSLMTNHCKERRVLIEREQEKLTMPRNRWRVLHIRFGKRRSREYLDFIFTCVLLKTQLKCHQGILSTRAKGFNPIWRKLRDLV